MSESGQIFSNISLSGSQLNVHTNSSNLDGILSWDRILRNTQEFDDYMQKMECNSQSQSKSSLNDSQQRNLSMRDRLLVNNFELLSSNTTICTLTQNLLQNDSNNNDITSNSRESSRCRVKKSSSYRENIPDLVRVDNYQSSTSKEDQYRSRSHRHTRGKDLRALREQVMNFEKKDKTIVKDNDSKKRRRPSDLDDSNRGQDDHLKRSNRNKKLKIEVCNERTKTSTFVVVNKKKEETNHIAKQKSTRNERKRKDKTCDIPAVNIKIESCSPKVICERPSRGSVRKSYNDQDEDKQNQKVDSALDDTKKLYLARNALAARKLREKNKQKELEAKRELNALMVKNKDLKDTCELLEKEVKIFRNDVFERYGIVPGDNINLAEEIEKIKKNKARKRARF